MIGVSDKMLALSGKGCAIKDEGCGRLDVCCGVSGCGAKEMYHVIHMIYKLSTVVIILKILFTLEPTESQ